MKLCTGISELNQRRVVQKHTFAKKDDDMDKGRAEAPRGMLFEGILELLGRQIVGNGGSTKTFVFCVFWVPNWGRDAVRLYWVFRGVVPLINLIELNY